MTRISLILFFWSLLYLLVNLNWIKLDNRPPAWDQAYYLTGTQHLYNTIKSDGLHSFLNESTTVLGRKAPFISIATVPLFFIFGSALDSGLYLNLISFVFFSIFFFKLLSESKNEFYAAVALIVVSTMPLFYGLLRNFYVEFVLMSIFVAWLYYLLKNPRLKNNKQNIILGFLTGLGFLTKFHFFIFIFAPILNTFTTSFTQSKIILLKKAFLITSTAALIALPWYFKNLLTVLWHAKRATNPALLGEYYYGNPFSFRVMLKVFDDLVNYVLSPYYLLLTLILLFIIIIKKYRFQLNLRFTFYLVIPFLIFFFGSNKDYRFMLPLLPLLAILITDLLFTITKQKILIALTLVPPILLFLVNTLSVRKNILDINFGSLIFASDNLGYYVEKPSVGVFPNEQILNFINTDSGAKAAKLAIISEDKYFNVNNLLYLKSKSYLPINIKTVSYNLNYEQALEEINDSDYVTYRKGSFEKPASINSVTGALVSELQSNKWIKIDKDFVFPDGGEVLVYKKNEN